MNRLNQTLLGIYLYGSMPYRIAANAIAAQNNRAPVMILFYHRVADEHSNDWTISNDVFTEQVDWMQRHFDFVSLEEAQRRIRLGNRRPSVCITFDDGYAENCDYALPLLIKRQIPCTYFVTTGNVLNSEPFPHDVENGEPLRVNSIEQLRALSRAGIEIGGHTRTHLDLGEVDDPDLLYDEVVGASRDLSAAIDQPIRYFAFPYGLHENLNAAAFQLARENGFEGVCSAYGGYNHPGDEPFHLQRFHADPEIVRLRNWLTVDPRKKHTERFDFDTRAKPLRRKVIMS